eukprot:10576234-Lingulodinium_polyedra.AAC.1
MHTSLAHSTPAPWPAAPPLHPPSWRTRPRAQRLCLAAGTKPLGASPDLPGCKKRRFVASSCVS